MCTVTRYLLDIRLMGSVNRQIRRLSDQLAEKFNSRSKLVVPHITLAGPFSTNDEERLVSDFTRICADQPAVPGYAIGGYGFFPDSRAVFVNIIPDEQLREFRFRLSRTLAPYCTLRKYDMDSEEAFRFHATLAMKLDWLTFQRVKWYFRNQESVVFHHHPLRATLLRNFRILCEYDFIQGRMLSRAQAESLATRKRDFEILKLWPDELSDRD